MKDGCDGQTQKKGRKIELPILANSKPSATTIGESRTSKWRAGVLIALNLLMAAHIVQWLVTGQTISPIEPSEAMSTLQTGAVNAGAIFFVIAILATLIVGRFVCGWGCHIVALQDLCAWLLKKIGLTPRPFRSRLLMFVPLLVALYMFVWPTVARILTAPKGQPLIPQFTNHLVTTEFWATFPPIAVAIPFLFICGFMTVYFLGSKGFCTYACPYGGFFGVADRLAPGKIRVTDACNECGHCTATCTSNVIVHAEVKEFGMVVDPGCMKCMDCVSVCPNDALYFGFGKPSLIAGRSPKRNYSISWPEEILAGAVFFVSLLAVWDVYQIVPMLMALGIASITTFLVLRIIRLIRSRDLSFYRYSLRSSGKIMAAGWVFLALSLSWIGLNAHSGFVRYHERAGALAFQSIQIPDELALAQRDPGQWLTALDRVNIIDGLAHFRTAAATGLFVNTEALPKLAWLEFLSGNPEAAIELLGNAAARQQGQAMALSLYYRGAILNRLGHHQDAISDLDLALAERPDLATAHEERGTSLWLMGKRSEAIDEWLNATKLNPDLPLANNLLAGALAITGDNEKARTFEIKADGATPRDAYFHSMLALRLKDAGMNALAGKHFQKAIEINPAFALRFSPNK